VGGIEQSNSGAGQKRIAKVSLQNIYFIEAKEKFRLSGSAQFLLTTPAKKMPAA
jgi:hypothetical protein